MNTVKWCEYCEKYDSGYRFFFIMNTGKWCECCAWAMTVQGYNETVSSGKSTLSNINITLDFYDKFYDGYGSYDAIRRNIDQDEIL